MATQRHNSRDKGPAEKKDIPLNIRVAASEKAAFVRAAEIAGIPLSAWMRQRLRAAALRDLDNVGEAAPFLVNRHARMGAESHAWWRGDAELTKEGQP